MSRPSPGHAITMRVAAPAGFSATSELAAAAASAGAEITALDMIESTHRSVVVDITCNTSDEDDARRVSDAVDALPGVEVRKVSDRTFLMHLGGLFRGLLDAAARDITTPMLVAAAEAIASCVGEEELNASYIVPSVFDPRVAPAVAAAVIATATVEHVA